MAQTERKTSLRMIMIDRNSANTKIYTYEIKQNVSKNFFLLLRTKPLLTTLRTVFSYYHSQRLLFSPTKNNLSTTLTPPPKNRYIHIVECFFVDSIYSKTIYIIRKTKFLLLFLNRGPMCKTRDLGNVTILQVAF